MTRETDPTAKAVVVPVEPTADMLRAAIGWRESDSREGLSGEADMFDRAWSAMLAAAPQASLPPVEGVLNVDALAQEIRRVDGNHDLGSGELAEALMPFLAALSPDTGKMGGEGFAALKTGFATTVSEGNPEPAKRRAYIKIEFRGEGCTERAQTAFDYLDRLVKADTAAPSAPGEPLPDEGLRAALRDAREALVDLAQKDENPEEWASVKAIDAALGEA